MAPYREARLGIMVTHCTDGPSFVNSRFYQELSRFGASQSMSVFVFRPEQINWSLRKTEGYYYNTRLHRWLKRSYPLPDLIYDRYMRGSKTDRAYRKLIAQIRQTQSSQLLGYRLGSKWQVKELLESNREIAPHIPATEKLTHSRKLFEWLDQYSDVVIKPAGGSQGKDVARIHPSSSPLYQWTVTGRDSHNRLYHLHVATNHQLRDWINGLIARRLYIVQPYLDLTTDDDEPYDIRSFMQKNRHGEWQFVGMALRRGKPDHLTSNLHGGGTAERAEPFLDQKYGPHANILIASIRSLSETITRWIESRHGRLFELGIDFGIDRSGRLWLLEVNSKPGRSIFNRINDKSARTMAVCNPVLYARYLWNRQLGG